MTRIAELLRDLFESPLSSVEARRKLWEMGASDGERNGKVLPELQNYTASSELLPPPIAAGRTRFNMQGLPWRRHAALPTEPPGTVSGNRAPTERPQERRAETAVCGEAGRPGRRI